MQLILNDRGSMNVTTAAHGCAWGHAEVQGNAQLCPLRGGSYWTIPRLCWIVLGASPFNNPTALTEMNGRVKLVFWMWFGLGVETQHYLRSPLLHSPFDIQKSYYGQVLSCRCDEHMIWLTLHSSDESSGLSSAEDLFLPNIQKCWKRTSPEEPLVLQITWFICP